MNIKELEDKHLQIWVICGEIPVTSSDKHTKLSIEFAISVLEEIDKESNDALNLVFDKIQELKTYLKDE